MNIIFTNVDIITGDTRDIWKLSPPLHKDFILSCELSSMYKSNTIYFDSNILYCISRSVIDDVYTQNMIVHPRHDNFNETQRISISNMLMNSSMFQSAVIDCLRYISDCYERSYEFLTRVHTGRIFTDPGCITLIRLYILCNLIEHLNVDDSLLFSKYKNIGYIIEEYLSSIIQNSQNYNFSGCIDHKSKLTIKVKLDSFIVIIKHLIAKIKNRTYKKKTFINRLQTYNHISYFCNINPQKRKLHCSSISLITYYSNNINKYNTKCTIIFTTSLCIYFIYNDIKKNIYMGNFYFYHIKL